MSDDPARHFEEMAKRVRAIDVSEFAGAVVIVPSSGEPITFLLTDPTPKLPHFWSGLASRVEIAAAEAQRNEEAANSQYGGRR